LLSPRISSLVPLEFVIPPCSLCFVAHPLLNLHLFWHLFWEK